MWEMTTREAAIPLPPAVWRPARQGRWNSARQRRWVGCCGLATFSIRTGMRPCPAKDSISPRLSGQGGPVRRAFARDPDGGRGEVERHRVEAQSGNVLGVRAQAAADDEGAPAHAVEPTGLRPLRQRPMGLLAIPGHRDLAGRARAIEVFEPAGRVAGSQRSCRQPVGLLIPPARRVPEDGRE